MARPGAVVTFPLLALLIAFSLHLAAPARGVDSLTASAADAGDPCDKLNAAVLLGYSPGNGYSYVRPSAVLGCARAMAPFDAGVAFAELENVTRYFRHFYPSLHVAKRAPDARLPLSVDILAELAALRTRPWQWMEDFFVALAKVVEKLRDGHTGYQYFQIIRAYYWFPLPLVAVVEGGQNVVRVAPPALTDPFITRVALSPLFHFNASRWQGARVVNITGVPAWQFMTSWARDNGNYLSQEQRLNDAFAHTVWSTNSRNPGLDFDVGSFAVRRYNPRVDSFQMVVQRPGSTKLDTILVPWVAEMSSWRFPFRVPPPQGAMTSLASTSAAAARLARGRKTQEQDSVSQDSVAPPPPPADGASSPSSSTGTSRLPMKHVPDTPRRTPESQAKRGASTGGLTDLPFASIVSSTMDLLTVYKLTDGKTAVIRLPTMDPYDGYADDMAFVQDVLQALQTADRANCSQVIIDVSSNGGGIVEFVPIVVGLLFGPSYFSTMGNIQDDFFAARADTQLVRKLANRGFNPYRWTDYLTTEETLFASKKDFFYPLQSLSFGSNGFRGNYSSLFKDNITDALSALKSAKLSGLRKKKYLLLSDGLCFSACDDLARVLRWRFGVPLVTVGGSGTGPLPFSGGGGGYVFYDASYDFNFPLGLSDKNGGPSGLQWGALPMKVVTGFFNGSVTAPTEFLFMGGDFKLPYSWASLTDPSRIYLQAARFFK